MKNLTFIERNTVKRLFGIREGYIFKYLVDRGAYNKNITKDLIEEACGINIYNDTSYSSLSQQKCVEKIWDECSPAIVANLLELMCQYFSDAMETSFWSYEDQRDYSNVQKINERLKSQVSIGECLSLSSVEASLLWNDIDNNIRNGTPELAVDRLHTYATIFLRDKCYLHGIATKKNNHEDYPLHSLVGMLKKWYQENNYFQSEFALCAIGCSISVFEKFNQIRNQQSAAHPNHLLSKSEAEYTVHMVISTLRFIDQAEAIRSVSEEPESP